MTAETSAKMLEKYKQDIHSLRQAAKELKLSDQEINTLFEECFKILEKDEKQANTNKGSTSRLSFIFKLFIFITIIFITIFILLSHHQPTSSLVLRNVQELIYPGLKLLRLLAMPIIKIFPSLSELYDETCLVENPYFQVTNMECWPCENVHSVMNLTDSTNLQQTGIPYIIQTLNKSVHLEDVKKLYKDNKSIFDHDAQRIKSNNPNFNKIENILNLSNNYSDTHILWRINRMVPARLIRTLFPKPHFISAWSGQSNERFIMIDDPKANPYILPSPECSLVLLTQGTGERTIVLKPSRECAKQCKVISVILRTSYTLVYNWWYWRPISLPTQNNSQISISYMSSFC